MMLRSQKNLPKKIIEKAVDLILKAEGGEIQTRSVNCSKKIRVINIGREYRILKSEKRSYWYLCNHSEYNKLLTNGSY